MAVLSKVVQAAKDFVTRGECKEIRDSCDKLSFERRGRIADNIKALRREIRLGYSMISLFIAILAILIRTGVI